jgi:uncharacterized protein YkwD
MMSILRMPVLLCLVAALAVLSADVCNAQSGSYTSRPMSQNAQVMPTEAEQLFALANQTRTQYGLGRLQWDQSLAAGALQHCMRMAREGPISHRYGGEPDVTARAAQAGAHFSLLEENVAVGPYASGIHQGWMNSRDHRENLLNPAIDRVGIAVVAHNGVLYAVADYDRAAQVMTQAQVEANFAAMLRARGLAIVRDPSQARAVCSASGRMRTADTPDFLITWQNSDLTQLPAALSRRVASRAYRQAAVGSCSTPDAQGGFTSYRVAVLLYGTGTAVFASR